MATRKVIWVVDINRGSSPSESASFAMECGLQGFGTATVFKVDGEFVDIEGDEPSENRPCFDGVFILTPEQMAKVLNEWQRRYVEEPTRFENDMTTLKQFMADEAAGSEPTYGVEGAAYMMQIAKDLGFQ